MFDKKANRNCACCVHGSDFMDNMVLCKKKGPVTPEYCCGKFKYDPLRRKPLPPARPVKKYPKGAFDL